MVEPECIATLEALSYVPDDFVDGRAFDRSRTAIISDL